MAYREFVAGDGREWRAWDTYPAANLPRGVASPMIHGWVTFEHGSERRRLAPPPKEWADAGDVQLRAWLDAAARIVRVPSEAASAGAPVPAADVAEEAEGEAEGEAEAVVKPRAAPALNAGTQSIIDQSRRTLEKMRVAIEESEERNPNLTEG